MPQFPSRNCGSISNVGLTSGQLQLSVRLGLPAWCCPRTGFSSLMGVLPSCLGVAYAASITYFTFSLPGIKADTTGSAGFFCASGRLLDLGCNITLFLLMYTFYIEPLENVFSYFVLYLDWSKSDAKLNFIAVFVHKVFKLKLDWLWIFIFRNKTAIGK